MNCQDMAHILDEQEVDDLLAGEQSDVQAHLATCRDCARDWQIHAQLSGAAIPAVPAKLRALYPAQAVGEARTGTHRRSRFILIGALVAVAAAASMLVVQMNKSPTPAAATAGPVQVEAVQEDPVQVESSLRDLLKAIFPWLKEQMDERESKAVQEWMQRVTEWLAKRDDPDALITAAMLLRTPKLDDPRIQSLLRRATALAPESARIQGMAMMLCLALNRSDPGKPPGNCDATPYEQALRRLAPDNALGWAEEVNRASRAGDQEALKRALAALARARTFDLYWNPGIVSMTSQIRAALVAPPDPTWGLGLPASREMITAIGAFAALPTPAFQPITKFCKAATDERTILDCRQIGVAMRAGDTMLVNSIGLAISGFGVAVDSAEARSLLKEKNQIKWAAREMGLLGEYEHPHYLDLLAGHARETDAMRALLQERGIPTEPPPDWNPDNPSDGFFR